MSEHIILTAEEAEKVRGVTRPGHALDPVEIKDGTFILPVEVLSDPAHQDAMERFKSDKARAVDLHEPTKRRIVRRDELKEDLAEDIKGGR